MAIFRVKLHVTKWKRTEEHWLNLYRRSDGVLHAGGVYRYRAWADAVAKPHRYACVPVRVPRTRKAAVA